MKYSQSQCQWKMRVWKASILAFVKGYVEFEKYKYSHNFDYKSLSASPISSF